MRLLTVAAFVLLAGCQPPTPMPAQERPATSNASGLSAERRAAINSCLVEMGKDPLPEVLSGINAPMNRAEGEVFQACMSRQNV